MQSLKKESQIRGLLLNNSISETSWRYKTLEKAIEKIIPTSGIWVFDTWSDGGFWVGGGGLAWLLGAFCALAPAEAEANWLLLLVGGGGRSLVGFDPESDAFGVLDFLADAGLVVAFFSDDDVSFAGVDVEAGWVDEEAFTASSSAIFLRMSFRPFNVRPLCPDYVSFLSSW